MKTKFKPLKRIVRKRYLTKKEAIKFELIRKQIKKEFPPLKYK